MVISEVYHFYQFNLNRHFDTTPPKSVRNAWRSSFSHACITRSFKTMQHSENFNNTHGQQCLGIIRIAKLPQREMFLYCIA